MILEMIWVGFAFNWSLFCSNINALSPLCDHSQSHSQIEQSNKKTINVSIKFKGKSEALLDIFTWINLSLGRKQDLPINGWSNSSGISLDPTARKACLLFSKCSLLFSAPNSASLWAFIRVSKRYWNAEIFCLKITNYQITSPVQFSTVFNAAGMQQWMYSDVLFSLKSGLGQKLNQWQQLEFSSGF